MSHCPSVSSPLQQRVASLTKLLELALQLSAENNLDRILRIATQGVCDAVACERSTLYLHDEQRGELYTRTVTELEIAEIRHPIDRGVAGWVATHRQVSHVPDPPADPRWDSSVDRRTGFHTVNILAAPVISGEDRRLLGVLQLLNKPDGFDELDEQLLQAFAAHVAVALERRRLQEQARQVQELRQSLEMSRRIQVTFLPDELPQIPGYQVAAGWEPAEFVSGDYYDWSRLPDGRWGFVIGDVSGHGLAAALIMASVRAMVHVLGRTQTDPDRFTEVLRESIAPDLRDSRFISFLVAVLDPRSHRVEFANAGHAPAFWLQRAEGVCRRLEPTTVPLGFPAVGLPHAAQRFALAPGDLLFLGTDGLAEARNGEDQMFGTPRLMQLVQEHADLSAADLVGLITTQVHRFHGRSSPLDDTTLVVIRRTP